MKAIENALIKAEGNMNHAAELLGISRFTLQEDRKVWSINEDQIQTYILLKIAVIVLLSLGGAWLFWNGFYFSTLLF